MERKVEKWRIVGERERLWQSVWFNDKPTVAIKHAFLNRMQNQALSHMTCVNDYSSGRPPLPVLCTQKPPVQHQHMHAIYARVYKHARTSTKPIQYIILTLAYMPCN